MRGGGLNQRTVLRIDPTTRQADLAALEQLPPDLRRIVQENTVSLSASSVLAFLMSIFNQGATMHEAEIYTARKLRTIEAQELAVFAERYRQQHGHQMPHVAADVSILRYQTPRSARRSRASTFHDREAV